LDGGLDVRTSGIELLSTIRKASGQQAFVTPKSADASRRLGRRAEYRIVSAKWRGPTTIIRSDINIYAGDSSDDPRSALDEEAEPLAGEAGS